MLYWQLIYFKINQKPLNLKQTFLTPLLIFVVKISVCKVFKGIIKIKDIQIKDFTDTLWMNFFINRLQLRSFKRP